MKKLILVGLIGLMISSAGFSQATGGIYEKSIEDNSAIPYPFLREADVIWSKAIYRLIDLREKMNLPLYYPLNPTADGRMSLSSIILGELEAGNLNAFDPIMHDVSVTYTDVERKMGGGADTVQVPTMSGAMKDTVLINPARQDEILQYLVYEEWYFDKKHSRMDVRIMGLIPIRVFFDPQLQRMSRVQLFWINFNDFRDIFARHEAYNTENDAQRISYDDLFMQRRFTGVIYAESNVYDDRQINQYKTGKAALFEAERIKQDLQDFEHDLWEY